MFPAAGAAAGLRCGVSAWGGRPLWVLPEFGTEVPAALPLRLPTGAATHAAILWFRNWVGKSCPATACLRGLWRGLAYGASANGADRRPPQRSAANTPVELAACGQLIYHGSNYRIALFRRIWQVCGTLQSSTGIGKQKSVTKWLFVVGIR